MLYRNIIDYIIIIQACVLQRTHCSLWVALHQTWFWCLLTLMLDVFTLCVLGLISGDTHDCYILCRLLCWSQQPIPSSLSSSLAQWCLLTIIGIDGGTLNLQTCNTIIRTRSLPSSIEDCATSFSSTSSSKNLNPYSLWLSANLRQISIASSTGPPFLKYSHLHLSQALVDHEPPWLF